MNQIEMNYTNKQKLVIKNWKESLYHQNIRRKYTPVFEFNKYSNDGIALYHLNIISDIEQDGSVYVGGEFHF